MQINETRTETSRILKIGQRARKLQEEQKKPYLMLHRGVNAVVNIDINSIAKSIDFNSTDIQVYPGTAGKEKLRRAISDSYFKGKANPENLLIMPGGISGLDITFQNIQVDGIALPNFFWGSYAQLAKLRKIKLNAYSNLQSVIKYPHKYTNQLVIINDPGNPLGEKHPDTDIFNAIDRLYHENIPVLIDSPYRRVFMDNEDDLYQRLLKYPNVIIVDSFSKSMGLSGQRIGFLHSQNKDFIQEAKQRLLYATNGVNAFAQELIYKLISTEEGKSAIQKFKRETSQAIAKNIDFLINNNLLSTEFYKNSKPMGIFASINRTEEELLANKISAVSMSYFSIEPEKHKNHSRICVSVPHEKFVKYLNPLVK
ncbi:pyridoxal phosphate-dependent aminotransferase [Salinivirga cyanobacteriivorans]|uniref:Aminotransferase n=1 Tax=Salinivirga cyanobacteriivorans TaxID=1307839 RepID=A0A0S2HYG7_9BACT|nr:pyridoxal phosphate-dependent aminotransferase [Salinivirga cyanobacteriivorans]ALO15088.1 aspartate aminotransferase [Salinivirga cyanobacteriivorans]